MVKRMVWNQYFLLLFLALYVRVLFSLASINVEEHNFINGDHSDEDTKTKWAVLVAGSRYYENYRHQADVCHAYQILKKGGLKDENIIVFMYDDIAFNTYNPRPGVIINKPDGPDVYDGVPKDYTGKHCTASNLYAAILGNKSALTGGSGKVVDSDPNDHIFIYYTDHGAPGLLQMPEGPLVYAKDLMKVLKKKHEAKAYKSMVIYVEACESGSMFEGLLPKNMNIYATTASNGKESSYGAYCPGDIYAAPPEYDVCLGDMYSISWLEDSDKMDARKETLGDQYEAVKRRTEDSILDDTSHVMQYGDMKQRTDFLISYIGSNPANENITSTNNHDHDHHEDHTSTFSSTVVSQRDANLLHYWHKFHKASPGSGEKLEAQKQLNNEISQRKRIDNIMNQIGKLLFGTYENGSKVMNNVKPSGQPLVDDWDCFKMHVETYEKYCGRLSIYGMKYTRAFANMCDVGITKDQLVEALVSTCSN